LTNPGRTTIVNPAMINVPARLSLLVVLLAPGAASAQGTLPKQSPFAPSPTIAPVVAPQESYEFAGVSLVGKRTDVIIHDKSAKKKHWIGIGDTVDGITVLRYDPNLDRVVIRVNGTEKELPLRKAATASSAMHAPVPAVHTGFNVVTPAPAVPLAGSQAAQNVQAAVPTYTAPTPLPTVPPPTAAPATPQAQARAETEARMLVSDLLEIGMAQRKAYEEAQRKSAGQSSGQTPPAEPPPGTPPQP
jgi:hypothetical protein